MLWVGSLSPIDPNLPRTPDKIMPTPGYTQLLRMNEELERIRCDLRPQYVTLAAATALIKKHGVQHIVDAIHAEALEIWRARQN
jgi:hypothetical protein